MKTTKNWNKKFLVGMLGMVLNCIVLGCASAPRWDPPIIYDPQQPKENQSMLLIHPSVKFENGNFDGKEVDWHYWQQILIPSGSHTLVYGYTRLYLEIPEDNSHYYNVFFKDYQITYDFKAEYVYLVDIRLIEGQSPIEKESYLPVIEEIGVVPWKVPAVSNDPTKFEGTWKSEKDTIVFSGNTVITEDEAYPGLLRTTWEQKYTKSVFTFTDNIIALQSVERLNKREWQPHGFGATPRDFKYEFMNDGGLVLTDGEKTSQTYYKKK